MFNVRKKTEKDASRLPRRRSTERERIYSALIGLADDEVISIPTSVASYNTVRSRVHDVNRMESSGQVTAGGKGVLCTHGVYEGARVVATEVMRSVLTPRG